MRKRKIQLIKAFPKEVALTSTNPKVQEVINRLEDSSFIDRIRSYSESYWDQKWSQWKSPSVLRHEKIDE